MEYFTKLRVTKIMDNYVTLLEERPGTNLTIANIGDGSNDKQLIRNSSRG
ncbi:hypothetical protein I6N90_07630 [Paenibacillus sp. GSMTC-2017]|nr:hypothetical protein [Paenibacillus sp. GSMTC-2017]MBH5317670.1 hypothetical protein [Paenibacillus sp. GSMTC-2017]